jgi:murein DD-endopeptidase MepM/ murein hydrolase activator NlpD
MKVRIKTRKKRSEARRIHVLSFILLSFSLFIILSFIPKDDPLIEEIAVPPAEESPSAPAVLEENKKTIRRGMTLSDILAEYGIPPAEIHNLRREVKPVYDLARIKAGQEIRVYTTQPGELVSLEYDIDDKEYLHVQKKTEAYTAEIKNIPYEIKVNTIWGSIEDYLITAVNEKGEEVQLALDLADIFAWDIDFYADLRKGDSFKVIFEKKFLNGKFYGYRNILASEFTSQGKTFYAFRYTYPDTKEVDYFDLEGGSLRKSFRKSPIKFTKITSRFSYNRLHPIRKVYRPHLGVDYAAAIGTPVQATADGTVISFGIQGASGRMVRLRHKNRYETMYLHLRDIVKWIRKGAKVKEGQVIGHVGSSGESTGPHLDYRIKKDGRFINPLTFKPEPAKPLREEFLEDFKRMAENYIVCFDASLMVNSCLSNF